MPWVSRQRELRLHAADPAEVLSRVRDGLVGRKRVIRTGGPEDIVFRGGWLLAVRTSNKPIRGAVEVAGAGEDVVLRISISDAAMSGQVAMLGFERRQYEAVIDRELSAIQSDVERGDAPLDGAP